MEITRETLIKEFGMKESTSEEGSIIFPLQKVISLPPDDDDDDDDEFEEMSICVTNMHNVAQLCLQLPDGSTLYLCPSSIEELKIFEKCIASWEPNY